MPVKVTFGDGSVIVGATHTDVLAQLCGGWNPPTVSRLRYAIANRTGLDAEHWERTNDNRAFLEAVEQAAGRWKVEITPE